MIQRSSGRPGFIPSQPGWHTTFLCGSVTRVRAERHVVSNSLPPSMSTVVVSPGKPQGTRTNTTQPLLHRAAPGMWQRYRQTRR